MPDVITTAKKWKWVLDNCPLSGEIIEIREIERASQLGGIIKSAVNADVVCCGGEGSSQILSLRGASPEQTLFLIDGSQINTAQGGSIDLSQWPVSWIDRIEVYRAGGSVEMGAQAIGGIVNIVTKKEKNAHKYVSLRAGSQNLLYMNAFWASNYLGDKLSFWAGAQRKQGDGDFWFLDGNRDTVRQRENADYEDMSAMTKLGYDFGDDDLELNIRVQDCDRGSPGFSEFPTPDARLHDQTYAVQGRLTHNGSSLRSEGRVYTNWLNRSYRNPHPIIYADDRHENFALGAEEKCYLSWTPKVKSSVGIELRKDNLVSTTDGRCERKKIGTFLQNEIMVGNKESQHILLLPGIRVEWVGGFQSGICPGLGVLYTLPGKFLTLKASTEKTFRPPGFDDLFWPASAMAVGNPDLLPERARNIDIGVIAHPFSDIIRTEVTGFHRSVKDLIEWAPGAKGIWRPHNIGEAGIRGIEVGFSNLFRPRGDILVEILSNYAYTRAENLTDERNRSGKQLARRPEHKANLQAFVSYKRCQISTAWNYTGHRYTTAANTKWIPQYVVGDWKMLYRLGKNIGLSVEVKNVMGIRYVDIVNFPIPGRTLSFNVSFDF
jgi:vitamin B12 transporter